MIASSRNLALALAAEYCMCGLCISDREIARPKVRALPFRFSPGGAELFAVTHSVPLPFYGKSDETSLLCCTVMPQISCEREEGNPTRSNLEEEPL